MFKQSQINSSVINPSIIELLGNVLPDHDLDDLQIGSGLSISQRVAFDRFKEGDNLAILSPAGCGKSMVIKTMEEYNYTQENYKKMYLCATTGVAAYNIGGTTIHSFMGFGTGEEDLLTLIKRINRNKENVNKLKSEHILVIDEISMLSAALFEKMDKIYQYYRRNKLYFGGVQLIITGDLLQNECIFKQNNPGFNSWKKNDGGSSSGKDGNDNEVVQDTRLLIESQVYKKMFKEPVILKENFRQKDDLTFINLLSRIRTGEFTNQDITLLQDKYRNFDQELRNIQDLNSGISPIQLVASNAKAQTINNSKLKNISEPIFNYQAEFNTVGENIDIIDALKKELYSQLKLINLLTLDLKKGARVMLIKNLDIDAGLVNGSMGVINAVTRDSVTVTFDNSVIQQITPYEWGLELFDCKVKVKQIPIILAYAITIHKSISLTLSSAVMDLADCFCNHMVYVAMSRVKSIDGLLLKSFNHRKITVNQKLLEYVTKLES